MSRPTLLRPSEMAERHRGTARGTYFVQTWGCQMNEEDSDQMALYLQGIGFSQANTIHEAHVVLLNTCSVRKKPEDKAFSLLGELAPIKKARPEMVLGVCGCMAQVRATEIKRRAPHVDFVVGTAEISTIPGLVEETLQQRKFQMRIALPERKGAVVTDIPERQVGMSKLKAFVPIQYGCDKFCSFCIVPTTRGRERSRPPEDIIDEVSKLAAQGTKEVILLGQTVNSYGKNLPDGRVSFSELLWQLSKVQGLERIRYTSPYPRDFSQELMATIRDCPKVPEHVHMPLQSGDAEVLKAMRRLYSPEQFLQTIEKLRIVVPEVSITTDIIVGFPGETESQFEHTLEMMQKVEFDGAFMFIYSPRPGTPASEMEQIPYAIKQARLARLIDLQNEITFKKNEAALGNVRQVLVEGPSPKKPDVLQGYSQDFRMIHFEGPRDLIGQIVSVMPTKAHRWGLSGEIH